MSTEGRRMLGWLVLSYVAAVLCTRRVDSCDALLHAIAFSSEKSFVIVGELACSRMTNWPNEVRLPRDLDIVGERFGYALVDLPNFTTIVVPSDKHLYIRDLIIVVHAVKGGTLPFVEVEPGGEVYIEYTAMISQSCDSMDVASHGPTVFDGEVGLLDPDGRQIARSCNIARVCSEDGVVNIGVVRSIDKAFDQTACTGQGRNSKGPNTMVAISVLTTVIFGIMVLVLLVIVLKMMSRRHTTENKTMTSTELVDVYPSGIHHPTVGTGDRGYLTMHETEGGSLNDPLALGNPNFKLSDIEIRDPLGRGSFGKVYKGHWQGTDVAVKCIIHGRSFLETRNEPFEAYLSRQVSHPNVVQTFIVHTVAAGLIEPSRMDTGHNSTSDFCNTGSPKGSVESDEIFGSLAHGPGEHEGDTLETWIVLEYCDRESLATAIRDGTFHTMEDGHRRPKLRNAILSALDVAHAMMYLHNVRIIHGDLKAANVLLKSDVTDERGYVCKVGDFGLSRFLAEDTHIETFTCGTITHMPPELLKGGVLTPAADVYSFAILMWELLTGVSPYGTKTHGEIVLIVVNREKRPPIPENCPEGYEELLEDCWRQCHLERPGFPEIVDRLKDLLDEEDHPSPIVAQPTIETDESTFSFEPTVTNHSVQHLTDNTGRMESPSDQVQDIDLSRCRSTPILVASPSEDTRATVDMQLDCRSTPCFMLSSEMSSPQTTNHPRSSKQ